MEAEDTTGVAWEHRQQRCQPRPVRDVRESGPSTTWFVGLVGGSVIAAAAIGPASCPI